MSDQIMRGLCIAVFVIALAGALTSAADSVDEAQAQSNGVPPEIVEIQRLKRMVDYLEGRNDELQAQAAKKQKESETKIALLQTQIDTQTAQAEAEIKRLGGQIKLLQQQLLAYLPGDAVARLDAVPEITASKLNNIADQYTNKVVKMSGVVFAGADPSVLTGLPALNISAAGFVSVDPHGLCADRLRCQPECRCRFRR